MPCNTLAGHVLRSQAPCGLPSFILLATWSLRSNTALMLRRAILKAHLSGASYARPGCKDIPHAVVSLDGGAIHGGLQPSKCRGEAPCTCDPACVTWHDSPASYHMMGGEKNTQIDWWLSQPSDQVVAASSPDCPLRLSLLRRMPRPCAASGTGQA